MHSLPRPKLLGLTLALALFLSGALFAGAPSVIRSAPFPNYQVGDSATLTISTSPVQSNAPVYQFRYKDGAPNGPQPTLVGTTNGSGVYSITVTALPEWVGSYTNEQFSVGSPSGSRSNPKNFSIAPITLPVACGCEHFGSQYDQFCEANSNGPPPANTMYRYQFFALTATTTFPYPHNPVSPAITAGCAPEGFCSVKVGARVDLLTNQGLFLASGTTSCASGTPGGF